MAANDPKTVDLLMARLNEANLGLAKFTKAMGEMNVALMPVGVELKKLAVSFSQWAVQTAVVQKAMTGISNAAFAVTAKLEPLALKLAQAYVSIETAIAPALQKISGVVSAFVAKLETATYHVVKQFEPLANIAAKVYVTLEPLGKAIAGAMGPLLSASAAAAKGLASVAVAAGRGVFTAGSAVAGAGASAAGAAASGASSAANLLIDSFKAPLAAFQQITGAAQSFVSAINPSAIMALEQATYNLTAAIGTALEPIIQVATGVLRDLNKAITPVMERLRPIVEQLSRAFASMADTMINRFASMMTTLMPTFKFMADVVSAMVPVVQAVTAALAGMFEVVVGLVKGALAYFGLDLTSMSDSLKTAMRQLADATLIGATHVMKFADAMVAFFGGSSNMAKDFVKGAREALTGEGLAKKESVGVARDARVGGIADFANNLSKNALLASPGGGQKSKEAEEKQRWDKLLEQMGKIVSTDTASYMLDIQKKMDELKATIVDGINAGVDRVMDRAVWKPAKDTAKDALSIITNGLSRGLTGY